MTLCKELIGLIDATKNNAVRLFFIGQAATNIRYNTLLGVLTHLGNITPVLV